MILSNLINDRVNISDYRCDPIVALYLEFLRRQIELPEVHCRAEYRLATQEHREQQTPALLARLQKALSPCRDSEWLEQRRVADTSDIYSIDYRKLSDQDLLDLHLLPDDHILESHGRRVVDGPVFPDVRRGKVVGVCVRNISTDLDFVRDAKYTFSNYGWFLYGYDLYGGDDEIYLTEGVFDAMALRHYGYKAIAFGSCYPQLVQLSVLRDKFRRFVVCFDDDMHGHYGAYYTASLLNCSIVLPGAKDVASLYEGGNELRLRPISRSDMRGVLWSEVEDYNRRIAHGWVPQRDLPYNK